MKTPRNLWPYGILAAFGLFFAAMTTTVTIALRHPETLVSADYYENELNFQAQQQSAQRAHQAGADLRFDPTARSLTIVFPAAQTAAQVSGTIQFYRASAPDQDRTLALRPGANGTQTLDLTAFATGPWRLRVNWQSGGQGYYLEQAIVVPAS